MNNKVSAKLVVDTGASMVSLLPHMAKKLDISFTDPLKFLRARTADGRETSAYLVTLRTLKLDNVEAKDVEAVVMMESTAQEQDKELGDGLLGMSFLGRYPIQVDHRRKKLILKS